MRQAISSSDAIDLLKGASIASPSAVRREFFESQLRNLGPPPSAEETLALTEWGRALPLDRWEKWLLSWARGLEAYGTPLSFASGTRCDVREFREGGMNWESIVRSNGSYDQRRELIARQPIYHGIIPRAELPYRLDPVCKLCENIHQGEDARRYPERVRDNIMLDFGSRVVAPIRYPIVPLALLWMSKDHDDMSTRVPCTRHDAGGGVTASEYRREPGKTRDALLTAPELAALFDFAHSTGLVAARNHQVSGKSIPSHDHWQLYPPEHYPPYWFERFAGAPDRSRIHRARGTPYDVLVIRDSSLSALAGETVAITNELECRNVVFSPYFVPGADSSMVLLAPLVESAGDRFVQIGGGIQIHGAASDADRALYERYVPARGTFPWNRYGIISKDMEPATPQLTKEQIFERYRPIDYQARPTWGDGSRIYAELSPTERRIYDALRNRQDQRDDIGHTDTVIYFTKRLAELMALPAPQREAATIAAITHDAGWIVVPRLKERWSELVAGACSSDPARSAAARGEMRALRKAHEEEAARLVRELAADHPLVQEIAEAVLDHDTRAAVPRGYFSAFLDADWLWRATLTCQEACVRQLRNAGAPRNEASAEEYYQALKREFTPKDFFLPWAYFVHRLEVANTMLHLQARFGWTELPATCRTELREELQSVSAARRP